VKRRDLFKLFASAPAAWCVSKLGLEHVEGVPPFLDETFLEIRAIYEREFRQKFGDNINLSPPSAFSTIIDVVVERDLELRKMVRKMLPPARSE
jgi:hypothetical protein